MRARETVKAGVKPGAPKLLDEVRQALRSRHYNRLNAKPGSCRAAVPLSIRHRSGGRQSGRGGPRPQVPAPPRHHDPRGGEGRPGKPVGREADHGLPHVRSGATAYGMPTPASSGHRFRPQRDPRPRRQGSECWTLWTASILPPSGTGSGSSHRRTGGSIKPKSRVVITSTHRLFKGPYERPPQGQG